MRINKLQIGNFGKFKDYELEMNDGFQIVYGRNEDGKSTLMAFIKMMFYSNLGKGRNIDSNLRMKYQPWDGSNISGAVEFEHDGIQYRLQKDLGPTPSKDKVTLINMGTGSIVPLGKSEEVGKRFFGLDLAGFERSFFIGQIGNFSSTGTKDEIGEKLLSNLVLSGDENVSQKLVLDRLNAAIEDMESKNHKKGILVDAKNELQDLYDARREAQELEQEQKSYIEKYNQLKKMIEEKKQIQYLLRLNEDKKKFDKISELIEKVKCYTEKIKDLEKENFSYEGLITFIDECKSLADEVKQARGSLNQLKVSNVDASLVSITDEEYKALAELADKEEELRGLLERLDKIFIPSLVSLNKARNDYRDAEATLLQEKKLLKGLEKFHENFERLESKKASLIDEKSDLKRKYEKDEIQWNSERMLREQKIKSVKDKLSIIKQVKDTEKSVGKKQNPFLLISLAVGILSIILAVLVHPMTAVGVVLAIIMAILGNKGSKQNEGMVKESNHEDVRNLEDELERLKKSNEKEEKVIDEKINDYEAKLTDISNRILEIQKDLEALLEKNDAYKSSSGKIPGLESKKEIAEEIYNLKLEAYNQEKSNLIDKYSNNKYFNSSEFITVLQQDDLDEVTARGLRDKVEMLGKDAQSEIRAKLYEKSCSSIKEYREKYMEYVSNSKNQNAIVRAETEYSNKLEKLLSKVSMYKLVGTLDEAENLIYYLKKEVSYIEQEKSESLIIAKGMGYASTSIDYLKNEADKMMPSLKKLEELWKFDFSEDELRRREKEFEENAIEEQYLEIQKKIKTPEKSISQIQEEIAEKEKEVAEKTEYFNALKIAQEVMQEASDEMRMGFGPELNRKTAGIFKSLTGGKYGNILVTKDYDILVQSDIHFREWKYLSNGTVDQAYLSLRLAITELISDKNTLLPLFLDDVLMQYDDERTDAALKFISDYSKQKGEGFQVLLFTCHEHIIEKAKLYTTNVIKLR